MHAHLIKRTMRAGCWWLTPIILATWKAEIGRTVVSGQPRQVVCETPSLKITTAKQIGGVAQAVEHLLVSTKP
jgi:hypothetical protein